MTCLYVLVKPSLSHSTVDDIFRCIEAAAEDVEFQRPPLPIRCVGIFQKFED